MALGERIDFGNVHINKKVIGDMAALSLQDIPGVKLSRFGIIADLFDLFGYRNFPGVYVLIDQAGQVSLNIRIDLDYGVSIPYVAHQVQERVQTAVEEALDIQLRDINVSIQSVVRRSAQTEQGGV